MRVVKTFLFLLFSLTTVVYAQEYDYIREIKPCEVSIQACIEEKATQYNVSSEKLHYIIMNESSYKPNATGDMDIICKRTGLPVRARGILQITECWYPNISDECAYDVECSLDKMLPIMADKESCVEQWTTCKWYENKRA